jgi:hypothetical protein
MFDAGKTLAARSRVTRILHLDRHGHIPFSVQSDQQLFLEQTGQAAQMTPIKSYLDGPSQILSKSGECDTPDFGARNICVESLSREGYLEENA